jgi:hypothetical protein
MSRKYCPYSVDQAGGGGRRRREQNACFRGKREEGQPEARKLPGASVDVVDHDDCDVLDAPKHRCKISDGPSFVAKNPAKRRQDRRRGGFHCASRNMQSADTLILKARVQR